MKKNHIFDFIADLSKVNIPLELNNPFGSYIPTIVKLAAEEFQYFIAADAQEWEHNLLTDKGKMFGVLVVQKENGLYGYLGAVSSAMPKETKKADKLIPSTFDDSVDDFFINRGMFELT